MDFGEYLADLAADGEDVSVCVPIRRRPLFKREQDPDTLEGEIDEPCKTSHTPLPPPVQQC